MSNHYTNYYNNIINGLNNTPFTNPSEEHELLKDAKMISFNGVKEYKETKCPISLEQFKEGEKLIQLPCNHLFSKEHLLNWLKDKHTCPVCRYELQSNKETLEPSVDDDAMRQYHLSNTIDGLIGYLSHRLRNNETQVNESLEEIFEIY